MKAIMLTVALFLTCVTAQAESLQQPVSYFSANCGYAPVNQQTATGFSDDGNYVYVTAHGYTACGSSGRGGGSVSYKYWCEQLTFDLGGHLVAAAPLKPATYAGYTACPWADPHASYLLIPSGYEASTNILTYNASQTEPILTAPY